MGTNSPYHRRELVVRKTSLFDTVNEGHMNILKHKSLKIYILHYTAKTDNQSSSLIYYFFDDPERSDFPIYALF